MNLVFFDIETKKFFDDTGTKDPADLGVSIVSLEADGKIQSFWEEQFEDMWEIFLKADRIIGFNSLHFDVPALQPYASFNFAKLPHFDILEKIKTVAGKRVSLNAIAKDTLGTAKIDSGANAVKYWEKHDKESLALLKKYCEADVAITKAIYEFAFNNKYLKFTDFWNTPTKVDLDFSFPKEAIASSKQSTLW